MIYLVGLLAVVFVILTVLVVNRILILSRAIKSKQIDDEKDGISLSSNRINATLMMIFFIVGTIAGTWSFIDATQYFLPEAASEHGIDTDKMFWLSMAMVTVAFMVTNLFLFYFAYKYQYKPGHRATYYSENHRLETIWTTAPAILMAIMVFFGWQLWSGMMKPAPENAAVIEIMGKQFNWQVRYPGVVDNELGTHNFKLIDANNDFGIDIRDEKTFDDFIGNTMYLPKGKPVLLKIRARDVLHSVFIPHLRVKMDAVPGMPTKFWFTPTKTTEDMRAETGNPNFNYEIACTEICGQGHFSMKLPLVIVEEEEYKKWMASQKPWLTTRLESDKDFISQIPEKIRAKAMKYMPLEVSPVAATVPIAPTTPASSSVR